MLFTLWICLASLALVVQSQEENWVKIKNDIRMPLELRVVNEGLAHDDSSWFMSNQHFLYKTSLDPMIIEVANHHAIPDELTALKYNHIGDIDHDQGIVYGGMETSDKNPGIIGAWNATDLSIIKYVYTEQNGMPWVAVDPSTRSLYSNEWNQVDAIQIYDMDTFALKGKLAPAPGQSIPKEIQGAAINPLNPGYLYLAINENCSIYTINLNTGNIQYILSDYYTHRPHSEYEMEGLTFWDLRNNQPNYGIMHMFGNFMTVKEKSIHSYTIEV